MSLANDLWGLMTGREAGHGLKHEDLLAQGEVLDDQVVP
jgi:hypothetical protein